MGHSSGLLEHRFSVCHYRIGTLFVKCTNPEKCPNRTRKSVPMNPEKCPILSNRRNRGNINPRNTHNAARVFDCNTCAAAHRKNLRKPATRRPSNGLRPPVGGGLAVDGWGGPGRAVFAPSPSGHRSSDSNRPSGQLDGRRGLPGQRWARVGVGVGFVVFLLRGNPAETGRWGEARRR